ncbi:MarR family transcriptional regulator [Rhodovastum atsumiense]|uniref:MarR family transcriptional regulator n=1 Tax=Rhodovastum atsumiense TaxID=504468 RepID=A0A5M6IWC3_9PROT|nr:MarR family transcriptional regulator [Rhodovastum atsumiense]KAA5612127.1 MarR family transcriptional regulator [Rhodovastum atsumiense]CAH2603931.1 MarR family transcriptional regulator [Rhodovastum atsumiense]
MKARTEIGLIEDAPRLDDLIGYHLRRASMFDMQDFATHFADTKLLRPVPFSVLCRIDEEPGITAAGLCRMLSLQRSNIVPILAELDEAGLLERRSDSLDQRLLRLFLTRTGKRTLASWRQRVKQREDELFAHLTTTERATLLRLLAKAWTGGS